MIESGYTDETHIDDHHTKNATNTHDRTMSDEDMADLTQSLNPIDDLEARYESEIGAIRRKILE